MDTYEQAKYVLVMHHTTERRTKTMPHAVLNVRLFTRQQRGDGPIMPGERQLFCHLFQGKVPTLPLHHARDDP